MDPCVNGVASISHTYQVWSWISECL